MYNRKLLLQPLRFINFRMQRVVNTIVFTQEEASKITKIQHDELQMFKNTDEPENGKIPYSKAFEVKIKNEFNCSVAVTGGFKHSRNRVSQQFKNG